MTNDLPVVVDNVFNEMGMSFEKMFLKKVEVSVGRFIFHGKITGYSARFQVIQIKTDKKIINIKLNKIAFISVEE